MEKSQLVFRKDFDKIELELELENLRKLIKILQSKNEVQEEHIKLLIEKNRLYEAKLQNETSEPVSEPEQEPLPEASQSIKDKISGALFGVALPRLKTVFAKIKERHKVGDSCPRPKIKVNLMRVAVVLGTLILISGVGYAGYRVWKTRYRHPTYLMASDEDEDSTEELFTSPGTSRTKESIVKTNSTDSFENPGISTDFTSILNTRDK